jgi:predicted nucleotidyltransferase/DNA-binding XRE family transcriptional regulator
MRYIRLMAVTRSAEVLRDARRRAGLTQASLAERAGVTQSVISAYESGHRQPALSTLSALVDATGFELDLQLRPLGRLDALTGPIGRRLRERRHELLSAAHAHGVRNVRVFGSVARGQDRPDSDVDLLADLPHDMGLLGLGLVRAELESILGAPVDLVPASDLKPDVRERALQDAIAL